MITNVATAIVMTIVQAGAMSGVNIKAIQTTASIGKIKAGNIYKNIKISY